MRRPGADLEEKPEPRVAFLAEAQNGDGMKQSGRGLTRAAIEKLTFPRQRSNRRVRPRPWKNVSCDEGDALCFPAMTVETPVYHLARAVERGDQILIAGISGPTPTIAITRFML